MIAMPQKDKQDAYFLLGISTKKFKMWITCEKSRGFGGFYETKMCVCTI